MNDTILRLFVSVPVACFRVAYAREYWETYPCPPPSTVYGMLLSVVGETNRLRHKGAEVALAMVSYPERSVMLRKIWRVRRGRRGEVCKWKSFSLPDYQELLTDVRLCVWLRNGEKEQRGEKGTLLERVKKALVEPESISRFGGLSLGESTHLVDEVRAWRPQADPSEGRMLLKSEAGSLVLPVWSDHVKTKGTKWARFELREMELPEVPDEGAWVVVEPLLK